MGAPSASLEFPTSGVGDAYRNADWPRSPLDHPTTWSTALKTTVAMMLGADAQIVLFWGPEYCALYNDAYAPTIGDKHPRALGRPARENWSELWDDLEPLLRGVRDTRKTFSAKDRPFYIERRGYGETVYFDVSYSAVPEADGSVGGVLCIVSETTERVRAVAALRESEARLRELNETLEQRILDRTRDLEQANAALRQAQKMEAVGRLTGGIAHDFNNLLQGITGNFDLIRRRPEDPGRVGRWADAGLRSAERGAKLASQLLAFSRTQKLAIVPIDITKSLESFAEVLRRTLGPQIRVRMVLATNGVRVESDEVQLEMAVLNLALNARDAMPQGGDLVISTKSVRSSGDLQLPDGEYVELSVTDGGEGMTADVIDHAFEPFFTTKETGKGTGLGLSQVYATLHQSGGAARIESSPGAGTTVRLYLRKTDALPSVSKEPKASREFGRLRSTILVVDDDADVRAFLLDTLEGLGYDAVAAEDGPSALRTMERIVPDAMILDFAMPGMNGAEVAKRVRDRLGDVPILFASGYSESAAVDSVQDERSRLLHKPFKVDQLQAALGELLKGTRG